MRQDTGEVKKCMRKRLLLLGRGIPNKELFRIFAARKLEREQKLDEAGAGKVRERTLTLTLLDFFFKESPLVFSVEFIY